MSARVLLISTILCFSSLAFAQVPIAQQAFVKSPSPESHQRYGEAVALSGNTLVVGNHESGPTHAGKALVYVRNGTVWSHQATLAASNAGPSDRFGFSVSISGDTIVVGALFEFSSATGVNGDQSDNSAAAAGAAYVFERTGTVWNQQAYLKASNTDTQDLFGQAVSISGDTIVVGAYGEDSGSTGLNGDELDNSELGSGAAYVFTRSGSDWSQQAYLKASNTDAADWFGYAVSVSGDTMAIGSLSETSSTTGVNGNQADNSVSIAGAAYVFTRSGSVWSQQAYIKASNTDALDVFGSSLDLSGETLVVGASQESSDALGVDGDGTNNLAALSGAAYVFVRSGTDWSQQAYLKAPNSDAGDAFGEVAISGDMIVVGAPLEQSAAAGVDGDQLNNALLDSGAAHVYFRTGSIWSPVHYLKPSNPDAGDEFGTRVAIFGNTIAIGSPCEDSASTGVNGAQSNRLRDSGAVYVFDPNSMQPRPAVGVDLCSGNGGDQLGCTDCPCGNDTPPGTIGGCRNSTSGSARLFATGDPSVSLPPSSSTDLRFTLTSAPPNTLCILTSGDVIAPTKAVNPCFSQASGVQALAFDGLRCAALDIRRHGGRGSNELGEVGSSGSPWGGEGGPNAGIAQATGFLAGQTRYFQSVYREGIAFSCMRGLNTSQAIEIVFAP